MKFRYFVFALVLLALSVALLSCNEQTELPKETEHVHTFGEWTVLKAPSCAEAGEGEHTCLSCGVTEKGEIEPLPHTEKVLRGFPATCKSTGITEGKYCTVCEKTTVEQVTIEIDPEAHDLVTLKAVETTCLKDGLAEGSKCVRCKEVIVAQEIIPAPGKHTVAALPDVPATCTQNGLTGGEGCSVCGDVLTEQTLLPKLRHTLKNNTCQDCGYTVDYTDPTLYDNPYGYEYLLQHKKAKDLCDFYNRLDKYVRAYHDNPSRNDSVVWASYSNLTPEEVRWVGVLYRYTHPLYYWMRDGSVNNGRYTVPVYSDYQSGRVRTETNQMIYKTMEEISLLTEGETSAYKIALAYYEAIALQSEYGKNNNNSYLYTDTILGFFLARRQNCSGYVRAFSMMLNAKGVRNIQVIGLTGSGAKHGWNLVQLDDGQWYWFDLTWDDTPQRGWGVSYNYFAKNDTDSVTWRDVYNVGGSPYAGADNTFMESHIPHPFEEKGPQDGVLYNRYPLPERSEKSFSNDEILLLRDTFTVDGCTYAVVGYNKVQLVSATNRKHLDIPETVEYNGVTYTVFSIGGKDKDGNFSANEYVIESAEKVTVPSTVIYIWDNALNSPGVRKIVYED